MRVYIKVIYIIFIFSVICVIPAKSQEKANSERLVDVDRRYVSIDNYTAWPNLTVQPNGTLAVIVWNQPSHGRIEGNAECWVSSSDGRFWEKRGIPVENKPGTNRMNVAAGLAGNGDFVVLVSGWQLKKPTKYGGVPYGTDFILPIAVSRSSDGGRSWSVEKEAFPSPEPGMTSFVPFGDIFYGEDGSLRTLAYAAFLDRKDYKGRPHHKNFMFRSDDDGHTGS